MLSFIIKLILASLIGDFLIQPTSWVRHKHNKKFRSPYLYYHIGIHAAALFILLGFNMEYWVGIIMIVVSHLLIDIIKLELTGKVNERWLFFSDQALHMIIIVWVVNIYFPQSINPDWLQTDIVLLSMAFIIFITVASSVIIRILVSKWDLSEINDKASLENAGTYIGMLERLFVFGFIVGGYWAGIGFLIAAKSVFRFGDLSRSSDRKLTEYILIGTLLSFGMATLSGIIFMHILSMLQ